MGRKVGENPAALRAAVFFAILEKPEGGGRSNAPPPSRARVKLFVSLAGPGPRRVMSVRSIIINRLRGNSQGNFTVMLNPMGISTNIFSKPICRKLPR